MYVKVDKNQETVRRSVYWIEGSRDWKDFVKSHLRLWKSCVAIGSLKCVFWCVTSVTNHSIFIKCPQVKLSGLKRGSYITKWLPHHKCRLNSPKKCKAKITPKIACFTLSDYPTAVTLVTNHSIFIECLPSKVIRAQKGVPTSQSGSLTTNTAWICQKNVQPKSPPK